MKHCSGNAQQRLSFTWIFLYYDMIQKKIHTARQKLRYKQMYKVGCPFAPYNLLFARPVLLYLSTSPNTRSIVPIMATASAKRWPLEIWSKQPKWAKPGALILHLYGRSLPSLTR